MSSEIIHQPHRLRIMAALDTDTDPIDFSRLKVISGATDGNLGAHLATLERAGLVDIIKEPIGRRTRTLVQMTDVGRQAFRGHLDFLQSIIDAAHQRDPQPMSEKEKDI
jgi:DNA-binding MarR family transcriptional regulator